MLSEACLNLPEILHVVNMAIREGGLDVVRVDGVNFWLNTPRYGWIVWALRPDFMCWSVDQTQAAL